MSDSEDEPTNDMFTIQNSNMMVSARGPSFNTSNKSFSFRNNVFSSTMQMPRNFERQRYAQSEFGESSSYRRRETSPMSIMSACDMRQRNYNNYHPRNEGISQKSISIGRCGSPMSVRSIGTTGSRVSALDIVDALKNEKFSNRDMRAITEAYKLVMKCKYKNRVRHHRRPFRDARRRRKSGYDSGTQAGDSSLSSDDNSTNTCIYKDNMSSCRSTSTNMSDFRRNIQDSYMNKNGFTQNLGSARGINLNNTQSSVLSYRTDITNSMPANFKNMNSRHAPTAMLQKERFINRTLLPSQRFKQSAVSSTIPEGAENIETDSDIDIFSESKSQMQNTYRKRGIDHVDDIICLPNQKKPKVASPCKNSTQAKKNNIKENVNNINKKPNEFIFAKPLMPVRKTFNFKNKEKCISKSAAPPSQPIKPAQSAPVEQENILPEHHPQEDNENVEDESTNTTAQTSDLSMKPSFLKRKLFSQKLDITEQKNTSSDNLLTFSPQNSVYSAIQKEKHKARKLTTQSCLTRDVIHDESNLLNLIHKIVPPDQMNVTNQTNKTDLQHSRNKTEDSEDKWDISSIISTRRNDQDESDTYTDEEIFNVTVKETAEAHHKPQSKTKQQQLQKDRTKEQNREQLNNKTKEHDVQPNKTKEQKEQPHKTKKQKEQPNKAKEQNNEQLNKTNEQKKKEALVVVERLPTTSNLKSKPTNILNGDVSIINTQQCVKSFWDTDFESDAEFQQTSKKLNIKDTYREDIGHNPETFIFRGFSTTLNAKKAHTDTAKVSLFSNTFDRSHKFDTTTLGIRAHRAPKRKEHDSTRDDDHKRALFEPKIIKQKTSQLTNSEPMSNKKQKTGAHNKSSEIKDLPPDDKAKGNPQKRSKKDKENEAINEQSEKPNKKQLKTQRKNNLNNQVTKSDSKKKTRNGQNSSLSQVSPKNKVYSKKTEKPSKEKEQVNNISPPKNNKMQSKNLKELNNSQPNGKKKNPKNKKATQPVEQNNNISQRSVRSCRSKANLSLDDSFLSLNGTLCLRSRTVVLSSPVSSPLFTFRNTKKTVFTKSTPIRKIHRKK